MSTHAGVLSKGITLGYSDGSGQTVTYSVIGNLQEVPALGGTVETVETTTLADGIRTYIRGIKDMGSSLDFKFLYDNSSSSSNYRVCKDIESEYDTDPQMQHLWEVSFPDGTKFHFTGQASVSVDSQGINVATTFTLSIAISSEITVVDPS